MELSVLLLTPGTKGKSHVPIPQKSRITPSATQICAGWHTEAAVGWLLAF